MRKAPVHSNGVKPQPFRPAVAMGACALVVLATIATISYADDVDAPVVRLEMSSTLTLNPEGVAPPTTSSVAVEPTTSTPTAVTAPASQSSGNGFLFAMLLGLIGLIAGAWLARQHPRDETPAQDRLSDELARLRERYLGLLNQRETREHPEWESTLSTLRGDLETSRTLLDNQRDQCLALQEAVEQQVRDTDAVGRERDVLADRLDNWQRELKSSEASLVDAEQTNGELRQAKADAQAQLDRATTRIDLLEAEADDAATLQQRITDLTTTLTEAQRDLARAQSKTAPLAAEQENAQSRLAEMLDKNLALEAELARLEERQIIADQAQARQASELIDRRHDAEKIHAEREEFLHQQLRDVNESFVAREAELSQKLTDAALQIEQSEQAKRRVLALLRQEKTDASDAMSELESLRVDHAHTLEQYETAQNMLSTAEDRVDDQKSQIVDLYEENAHLSRELAERENTVRTLATSARHRKLEYTSGIQVEEHAADDKLLRTIEQLTRSRDAALDELTRLRALNTPPTPSDSQDVRDARTLNDARMTIRRLESDLRMRGDLIDNLREDNELNRESQELLSERDNEIKRLKNELSMALDETTRVKNLDTEPRKTPRDVLRLRERIDGLQERLELKEKEIAILRAAAQNELADSPLQEHVTRLEADQEASVTVIRFLESEVQKLSRELETNGQLGVLRSR
ncbi:MAG: hypothetical protein AB8G16_19295 [Gammaproteobacteria bacterium]